VCARFGAQLRRGIRADGACCLVCYVDFFFSSRRRHTRFSRDWSSDVCSSDLFVWGITMFGHRIPIGLPGGYLIGTLLLINLVAAHIKRFQLTTKKIGIQLTHAGVILLLVGQLTTDLFSRETQIRFSEGQTRSYAESGMNYELAFITDADADTEEVVAIPARLLAKGAELKHEKLPFAVHVKHCWLNSDPSFRAPMMQDEPPVTTNGLARSFDFRPAAETKSMDSKNV